MSSERPQQVRKSPTLWQLPALALGVMIKVLKSKEVPSLESLVRKVIAEAGWDTSGSETGVNHGENKKA